MGLRILEIANNYSQKTDGIGKYASIIVNKLREDKRFSRVDYVSGFTNDNSKIDKITSFAMTNTINRGIKAVRRNGYDYVMMEYPFQEYNPLIIPTYKHLHRVCKKNNTKLVLSLHEYLRASEGRKKVIDILLSESDMVFVSNSETKEAIIAKNNGVHIRMMPSNIYPKTKLDADDMEEDFVYFGLVNKSKAFQEMLDGWNKCNKKNSKLYVITSSDLSGHKIPKGVKIIQNAEDDVVAEVMSKCKYSVIPVIPEISEINATYKTATLCGCICIGKYCKELEKEKHIVELESLDEKSFADSFEYCINMSDSEKKKMISCAYECASRYSIDRTIEDIVGTLM